MHTAPFSAEAEVRNNISRIPVSVRMALRVQSSSSGWYLVCAPYCTVPVGISHVWGSRPSPFPQGPLASTFHLRLGSPQCEACWPTFFSFKMLFFPLTQWDIGQLNYGDRQEALLSQIDGFCPWYKYQASRRTPFMHFTDAAALQMSLYFTRWVARAVKEDVAFQWEKM